MTAPTAEAPAPPPSPPDAAERRRRGARVVRVAGILAWLALACVPLAVVAGSVPVSNKRGVVDQKASEAKRRETGDRDAVVIHDGDVVLQDCGAPLVYVATARVDTQFEAGGQRGLSDDQVAYAQDHRCRSRVADRLRVVGWLMAGFVSLTVVALFLTLIGRSRARRAWYRSALAEAQPPA